MVFLSERMVKLCVGMILFLLPVVSGCAAVDSQGVFNRDQQSGNEAASGSNAYQTATPPTSPDLRGYEFSVVLFVMEGGRYKNSVGSIRVAVEDGFADLNARGGVNGAEIDLAVVEIPDNAEKILETVLETLEAEAPLAVLMAAPVNDALYYEINHQEVPFLYFGLGGTQFEPPSNQAERLFWLVPTPDKQLSFFVHSLWSNWEVVRPSGAYNELRIGYLTEADHQPNSYSEAVITRLEGESFMVPVRGAVPVTGNGSSTNFLLDAVQNGVTVVYSDTSSVGSAVLLNDIVSLALEDTFVSGGSIWSMDDGANAILLSDRSVDGFTLPFPIAWWSEDDNPAIQTAFRIHNISARPEESRDVGYLVGLGSVDLILEAMLAAVTELDSGKVGPKDMYQQLIRFENYNVLGGLFEVTYTDGERAPTRMRLWQFESNKGWTPISEWGEAP